MNQMTTSRNTLIPLALTLLFVLSNGIQVRVMAPQMPGSLEQLRDRNNLKLSINSADRYIYPDNRNTFQLPNMIATRNMVEVVSNIYLYPILMVDQRMQHERKYNLLHPVTRQIIKTVQEPIVLSPIQKINYFDIEGGFSIKSVLFSGYGMMIGMGVLLFFCYQNVMPKLQQAQQAPSS